LLASPVQKIVNLDFEFDLFPLLTGDDAAGSGETGLIQQADQPQNHQEQDIN
jgi:hypothetical protein